MFNPDRSIPIAVSGWNGSHIIPYQSHSAKKKEYKSIKEKNAYQMKDK